MEELVDDVGVSVGPADDETVEGYSEVGHRQSEPRPFPTTEQIQRLRSPHMHPTLFSFDRIQRIWWRQKKQQRSYQNILTYNIGHLEPQLLLQVCVIWCR